MELAVLNIRSLTVATMKDGRSFAGAVRMEFCIHMGAVLKFAVAVLNYLVAQSRPVNEAARENTVVAL